MVRKQCSTAGAYLYNSEVYVAYGTQLRLHRSLLSLPSLEALFVRNTFESETWLDPSC